ncbi:hypothetical protein B0A50_06838 [Salinomyces thailandicus]|uniref:Myb-like domain-containing protein n=1 Tax=Salinomyces thailandicus TaxID=706561 RepID=A0A4U0TPV3_9PEZI|nr:hypothetical protein B0A50_06838 [Salinomyces thailandica]
MADQRAWSNDDKNELLAEIIKSASPHPSVLFNVIANLNIHPRWEDMPLPKGRTVNQCRFTFDDIKRAQPNPGLVSLPLPPQTPLSAPPPGLKRSFQLEAPYPSGREIRPKPLPPPGASAQPSVTEPPIKRKRGRPTKAQTLAKAEAEAQARGSSMLAGPALLLQQQQQQQQQISPRMMTPAPAPGPALESLPIEEQPKTALPPTTRMPISAVLTPTAPKTASSSSSSSGKRRRGRSTRSELEGPGVGGGGPGYEYESPYGREDVPQDSPARTAVLRHREEQGSTAHTRQAPGLGGPYSQLGSRPGPAPE